VGHFQSALLVLFQLASTTSSSSSKTGVVCAYQDLAWRGWATPYFQIWKDYQGKRPAGQELYGETYPEKKDDAA